MLSLVDGVLRSAGHDRRERVGRAKREIPRASSEPGYTKPPRHTVPARSTALPARVLAPRVIDVARAALPTL